MNREFGKLVNGALKYAPKVLNGNGGLKTRPSAADYAAAGWLPLVDGRPETDAEHYAVATGWREVDGVRIERVYEVREIVPPPKVYSKLKLYAVLVQAGKWDALKAWLETQEVNGLNAYTAFTLAQDLTSDNELFSQFLAAAKDALGVDDATVAAILQAAEAT